MTYLLGQILLCLLVAALIGGIIGWLLKALRCRRREDELRSQLIANAQALESAQRQSTSMARSLSELEAEVHTETSRLRDRVTELEPLQKIVDARDASNTRLREELVTVTHEKQSEIEKLQERIDAMASTEARLDEAERERERLANELSALTREKGTEASRSERERTELDSLRARVKEQDATIARLRSQLETKSPNTQVSGPQSSTIAPIHSRAEQDAARASATPSRQALFDAPDEQDDLKKIKGIGPVLEGILNNLGITTFKQIARFTPDDVEQVTKALDVFPGRIARDSWIERAKVEHQKKYGGSI